MLFMNRPTVSCGFTLFEVLVAVSILSIGLLAVLQSGRGAQGETAWASRADQAGLRAAAMAAEPDAREFRRMTDASGRVPGDRSLQWRRRMDPVSGFKGLEDCRKGSFTVSWGEDEITVERVSCGR